MLGWLVLGRQSAPGVQVLGPKLWIWSPTVSSWEEARAGRQIWGLLGSQRSRCGVPRASPGGARLERDAKSRQVFNPNKTLDLASHGKAKLERDATSRNLLTRNEPLAAGWSRGS